MNNTPSTAKRIVTWAGIIIVIALIIWGLVEANKKAAQGLQPLTLTEQVTSADWIAGSSTAAITVVEYSDLECPACQAYHNSVLKRLVAEEGNKFRFVYRHFPLAQHKSAYAAALAAEAAGKQGKFWEMHDVIFEHQTEWSPTGVASSTAAFAGYAKNLGLDMAKFAADVADPAVRTKIEGSAGSAVGMGVNSTPTFFVNGKSINNPNSYEQFKAIIDSSAR